MLFLFIYLFYYSVWCTSKSLSC